MCLWEILNRNQALSLYEMLWKLGMNSGFSFFSRTFHEISVNFFIFDFLFFINHYNELSATSIRIERGLKMKICWYWKGRVLKRFVLCAQIVHRVTTMSYFFAPHVQGRTDAFLISMMRCCVWLIYSVHIEHN